MATLDDDDCSSERRLRNTQDNIANTGQSARRVEMHDCGYRTLSDESDGRRQGTLSRKDNR